MSDQSELSGPDLGTEGVLATSLADGRPLLGHYGGKPVLLVRRGADVFALGATCTHYGGPLAEGLFDGACVRCPWHHAAFDARTGEVARAPALDAVAIYAAAERDRWPGLARALSFIRQGDGVAVAGSGATQRGAGSPRRPHRRAVRLRVARAARGAAAARRRRDALAVGFMRSLAGVLPEERRGRWHPWED